MSQQPVSNYNPEAVLFIIDGNRIEGLGEDGVTNSLDAEHTVRQGIDGGMTLELSASKYAEVEVTVRAASKAARTLADLYARWIAPAHAGGGVTALTGMSNDPVNGTFIASGQVFFLKPEMPNFGAQSGDVTWRFAFCNFQNRTALLSP